MSGGRLGVSAFDRASSHARMSARQAVYVGVVCAAAWVRLAPETPAPAASDEGRPQQGPGVR